MGQGERQMDRQMTGRLRFVPASQIAGTDINNDRGDHIGDVQDLLMARGSGATRFVVVETGAVLGMGGRNVLVPYDSFRWDDANERLVLSSSKEQLEAMPEFNQEDWDLQRRGGQNRLSEFFRGENERVTQDEYRDRIGRDRTVAVRGPIRSVERESGDSGAEHVVVVVDTQDQGQQRVILGPVWYVTGHPASPTRGTQFDGVAWKTDNGELVAQRAMIDQRPLNLRSERGEAAWTGQREGQANAPQPGFFLADELEGATVLCQGDTCGDVSELIIESNSGRVAFISIDPDENFLGVGDTDRLVPWTLVSVMADGQVSVDATKDMILGSTEAPDDFAEFGSSNQYRSVYGAFGIQPTNFHSAQRDHRQGQTDPMQRRGAGDRMMQSDDWMQNQNFAQAFQRGEDLTVRGKVLRVMSVNPGADLSEARAVVVQDRDGARHTILLGSEQSLKEKNLRLQEGSEITVKAKRIDLQNRTHLIGYSFETDDGQEVKLRDRKRSNDR